MKFNSFACLLPLVTQSVFAIQNERSNDAAAHIQKRQQNVVVTTGATGENIFPRLEIRQMQRDEPEMYALTMLAMKKWQEQDQTDVKGYYQIAGIHGVPQMDYNGVEQCDSCGGTDGYCPHDSILFPSFHRAYLALFEQIFIEIVYEVLNSWPSGEDRQKYDEAAYRIRLPWWDWAARPEQGQPTLPHALSDKQVTIDTPTGSQTIDNPLFRHNFQDPKDLVYSPFTGWDHTLRYPNSEAANAYSMEQNATAGFESIRANMQDQLYQMFSTCQDYSSFANDVADSSSPRCSNSLESIHNTIHTVAGGPGRQGLVGGHMTYLALSSFDPLFWFHHVNVDRLFALWQALFPDSYGGSQVAKGSTWAIAQGSTQDENSPLKPFYKDEYGNFWTTNDVRYWNTTFKYTYPEFSESDGSRGAIANYINKLYGPEASATAGSTKVKRDFLGTDVDPTRFNDTEFNITNAVNTVIQNTAPFIADNGSLYQYVVNIQTPRYALNGSYHIYLFNGAPVSPSPSEWLTDANLMGLVGVLSQPNMMHHDVIATSSIPLTRTLQKLVGDGLLGSLMEDVMVPWLVENLQWKIVAADGCEIDPEMVEGFAVEVFASTSSQPRREEELPVWSEFVPLWEVTRSKKGGVQPILEQEQQQCEVVYVVEETVQVEAEAEAEQEKEKEVRRRHLEQHAHRRRR